jgi:hypothetical protein
MFFPRGEPDSPARGSRRGQGGCVGGNPPVILDLLHYLGIEEERQNDHRHGLDRRGAAGARERVHGLYAVQELGPGKSAAGPGVGRS